MVHNQCTNEPRRKYEQFLNSALYYEREKTQDAVGIAEAEWPHPSFWSKVNTTAAISY